MRRPAARIALQGGLWLLGFLPLAAVLQRPVFAAILVLGVQGLVIAISAVKQKYLREPLVFADLGLFTQAFRHPRLYVPYFGIARALAASAAFALVMLAGFVLEPRAGLAPAAWVALFILALGLLAVGSAIGKPSLEPLDDVRHFGVLGAMWLYWLCERKPASAVAAPFGILRIQGDKNPTIVAVQSESFFDVRRLDPAAPRDVLRNFDSLAKEADHGCLAVPVWGAYTMRTEFAFLSGIPSAALGVHRFNPYRRFARRGVATIASALRERGYRTLCLHPYPASFFARDRVFPLLGFDRFIDSEEFEGARRDGPYVADAELTERIAELVRAAREPLFVFAITMENHGPLHLEGADELAVYLRHLRNADAMIGALAGELGRKGDGVLCVYGDHVPGMPAVYAARGFADPRTDYLLWRAGAPRGRRADLPVEALGLRVLERAGLAAAPA